MTIWKICLNNGEFEVSHDIIEKNLKPTPPPLQQVPFWGLQPFWGVSWGWVSVGWESERSRGLSCLCVARQPQLIYQPAVREWQLFCCVASLFIYISHCYVPYFYLLILRRNPMCLQRYRRLRFLFFTFPYFTQFYTWNSNQNLALF